MGGKEGGGSGGVGRKEELKEGGKEGWDGREGWVGRWEGEGKRVRKKGGREEGRKRERKEGGKRVY